MLVRRSNAPSGCSRGSCRILKTGPSTSLRCVTSWRRACASVDHRAQLEHLETAAVQPDPLLAVKRRASGDREHAIGRGGDDTGRVTTSAAAAMTTSSARSPRSARPAAAEPALRGTVRRRRQRCERAGEVCIALIAVPRASGERYADEAQAVDSRRASRRRVPRTRDRARTRACGRCRAAVGSQPWSAVNDQLGHPARMRSNSSAALRRSARAHRA